MTKKNRFGSKSISELQFVRAELAIAATETLQLLSDYNLDMSIFDGRRTVAEQRKLVRLGVSWTMRSMHLPQADGLSWAVDLVPYTDGRLRWESRSVAIQQRVDECFALIADGMLESGKRHGFELEWGFALWGKDKPHFQLRK